MIFGDLMGPLPVPGISPCKLIAHGSAESPPGAEIRVHKDGQPPAKAEHALTVNSTRPGSGCSIAATAWCTSGLRKLGANSTAPGLTTFAGGPQTRKETAERRRSRRGTVGGPHKEVQIALERTGLGERGFDGGVFGAAVVHAVTQAQDRPAACGAADGRLTRGPQLLPRLGSFSVSGNVGCPARQSAAATVRVPSAGRRRTRRACPVATARPQIRPNR